MRPSGLVSSLLIVLSLIAGACSSGDDSGDGTIPTTGPADTTVETAATTTTTPTEAPSLTLDELRQRAFDGDGYTEIDVALAQFALDFGPVDGAIEVTPDESLPTTGTDTVNDIVRVWDELSIEQQTQVIDTIDRLDQAATRIGSVDGQDTAAVDSQDAYVSDEDLGAGKVVLASFAHQAAAPFSDEEALTIARQAAFWLVGKLGGSLNFDLSSAPPSEAERRSIDGVTYSLLIPGVGEVRLGTDIDNVRKCAITIYTHDHMTGPRLRSIIAHEAFHCWTAINGVDRTSFLQFPKWLHEGLATWVGEQYAASSFGRLWWGGFFQPDILPLFRTEYRAFGFFSQIAQLQGGDDALWDMIPDILAAGPGGDAPTFAAATDGLAPEEVAQLASTSAREPSWGSGWDLSGAGITSDARTIIEFPVSGSDAGEVRAIAGAQRLVNITLERPAGSDGPWVVTYDATGLTNNRWIDGTEFVTTATTSLAWCLDGACACPDGSTPAGELEPTPSNSDELVVALTGTSTTNAVVAMTLTSLDELCDEEGSQATGPLDTGGLNGTWKATGTSLTAMFESVFVDLLPSDGQDIGIQGVSGEVTMTLNDGFGELVYDAVTIIFEPDAALLELTLNGRGTFSWEVSDGALVIDGSTFEMVASSPALGEFPLEIPETSNLPGGPSTFAFSPPAGQLVLAAIGASTGTVWFPTTWVRQD